ncbi:uncharacterized protein JCM6883_001078 [Sporobolomyces salmoneus]|uniref:uncharacterized protein n=1 Tax=Sporobolomyces salmoneus TaxID=183962 RepID=UPI003173E852
MPDQLLAVTSSSVWFPSQTPASPATLIVSLSSGTILSILPHKLAREDLPEPVEEYLDAGEQWILPGLVDCHVHLNEPGRTEWEGFRTGTIAAVSGGVTTLIDMPLNAIPPTTTVENLELKLEAAKEQCFVDVGFWGGVIPGNEKDLKPLVEAGVKGFKSFLCESGVEEFPRVDEEEVLIAMKELEEANSLFLFHAELEEPQSAHSHSDQAPADPTSYSTFLSSRPSSLEDSAISLILRCASIHPTLRTHIVHLSASSALPTLHHARTVQKLPITVETCFHYLCLTSDEIPSGSTLFKCCPPIRSSSNRELLWKGLLEGTIDFVVSDHSPCTTELKNLESGDFGTAWGGIGGLGLGLSLLWSECTRRGIGMEKVLEWCAEKPAKQVGLEKKKGGLFVGGDADFVVFDPEAQFKVDKSSLHFKNRASPYEGMTLEGIVRETWLRGRKVWDRKLVETQQEEGGSGLVETERARGQLLL